MKIPYEEIAGYLKGNCSPSEKAAVEEWINRNPDHQAIFNSLKKEWKYLAEDPVLPAPDRERVWSRIGEAIDYQAPAALYTRKILVKYISLAACIALLLGVELSFLFNRGDHPAMQFTAYAPLGEKAMLTLPDSSRVWLNSGSALTYYARSGERVVRLQGEAFFEVTKDPRKAFIVQSGGVNVQVHGTSFNVSAYESDPDIEVSLEKGSISLINQKNGMVLADLRPNQMAQVSKSDLGCRVIADDAEITKLWTNNILKIYNNDIYEVVKKLERWYGVDIELGNARSDLRYTFVVKTESLRELLDLINKMTPITYKIEGKEVSIRLR